MNLNDIELKKILDSIDTTEIKVNLFLQQFCYKSLSKFPEVKRAAKKAYKLFKKKTKKNLKFRYFYEKVFAFAVFNEVNPILASD